MPLTFYPYSDDAQKGTILERIELLMDAAARYKATVLDAANNPPEGEAATKISVPRELKAAYNWEEISRVLRQIRELPEGNKEDKMRKAELLIKLAEVYEVLRGAKMAKLEAVRLALISEADQLRGGASRGV